MDLLAPESESLHLQKRVSGRSSNLKLAAQHRRNKITLQVFFLKNLKRTWEPRLDGPFQAIHLHGLSLFACVRRINFEDYSFALKKKFLTHSSRIQAIGLALFVGWKTDEAAHRDGSPYLGGRKG